ncbi:MAG: bifunctional precorrin-2 dehydrogenase/sirohydrochlorin ferrochelatase [Bacteroidales bacterium]|jgi:siroheme synthase-like protein|nr:bifunctional precorrin-2 dehydrogenase/sirohydrochlorin ferrochelatase [Bacteroidales bacterium]
MNRQTEQRATFLPISIQISGRNIVIVGGGRVGFHKATILRRFTDRVTVISPEFHEGFKDLPFECVEKEYEASDLAAAFLVYICTENETRNAQIKRDAERQGVLASVCDNPALCDFISPAIFKHENITIAVSSNGQNVRQSIELRDRIAQLVENEEIWLH